MKKKALIALTTFVMTTTLFSGCGKKEKVTAESLIENPFNGSIECLDADYKIDASANIDVSALFNGITSNSINLSKNESEVLKQSNIELDGTEEKTEESEQNNELENLDESNPIVYDIGITSTSTGTDTDAETETATTTDTLSSSMDVSLSLKGNIQTNGEIGHTKGDMTYDVFGMSQTTPYESYVDFNKEEETCTTYTYETDNDIWNRETIENNENISMDSFKIKSEAFDSLSLETTDDGYVVTGSITLKNLRDAYKEELGTLTDALKEDKNADISDELNDIKFNTTFTFDKKTKVLKKSVIKLDTKSVNIPSVEVNKLEVEITVNNTDEVEVVIPEDVFNNAVDSSKSILDGITQSDESDTPFDVEENVTDTNESNMATLVFGKQTITSDDITAAISGTYMDQPDDGVINAMVNIMNSYSASKFATNLDSYNTWNEENKLAIVYFYGLGVFSIDDLSTYNVDTAYIMETYDEIHHVPETEDTTETTETTENITTEA